MDGEETKLRALLGGSLDSEERDELDTMLAERPSLRRKLADIALEADTAVLHVGSGPVLGERGGDDSVNSDVVDTGHVLGSGGMAVVRIGRQLRLDRAVAVKSLREEAAFLVACYRPDWTPHAVIGSNVALLVNQIVLNYARKRRGFEVLPTVGQTTRAAATTTDPAEPSSRD